MKLSIRDIPLTELFADRLLRVVDFVFALCRNNTSNFPFDFFVYHNESCDLDGDKVLESPVKCLLELQLLVLLTIFVIVFWNHFMLMLVAM